MIRMPRTAATETVKKNLEIFASSAAARELDDGPGQWRVVEWSWTAGPPMRIALRDEQGQTVVVVVDATGSWRIGRERTEPKIATASEISAMR